MRRIRMAFWLVFILACLSMIVFGIVINNPGVVVIGGILLALRWVVTSTRREMQGESIYW